MVISVEIAFILYLTVILIFIFISLPLSLSPFPSVDDVSCVCFDVIQLCKDDATAASVAILVPIIVVIVGLSVCFSLPFLRPFGRFIAIVSLDCGTPRTERIDFKDGFISVFQPAVAEPP